MLDIHNNEFNEEIRGEWIKLKYMFNNDDYQIAHTNQYQPFDIEMVVFVSNDKHHDIYQNGFIGASPCVQEFNDYSFMHQIKTKYPN